MGSSSLQCLTRFIDLFLQRRGFDPIGRHFRWGMCFTEEYALPLVPVLPDLPSMSVMEPCLKKYFSRTHPLIPVLNHTAFISDVLRFSEMQQTSPTGLQGAVTSVDAPALVAVYAVLSIGMDDHEGQISPTATGYLTGAYSLVSHLLSFPYMSSVQALVLLAIAMRARGNYSLTSSANPHPTSHTLRSFSSNSSNPLTIDADNLYREGRPVLASPRPSHTDWLLNRFPSQDRYIQSEPRFRQPSRPTIAFPGLVGMLCFGEVHAIGDRSAERD